MISQAIRIVGISALRDNYIWVGVNDELRTAFVVDPGDALPVLTYLMEKNLSLSAILITHKHADHTHGVSALCEAFPGVPVYAHPQEGVGFATHFVSDNDNIQLSGFHSPMKVMHIPGHTAFHVAYVYSDALFCGDTLFSAGCGRVFEGTFLELLTSLRRLAALPDATQIYCSHEYTQANLMFANTIEPDNTDIKTVIDRVNLQRSRGESTLPSSILLEKKINPFLRTHVEAVISSVSARLGKPVTSSLEVFSELRIWKNEF